MHSRRTMWYRYRHPIQPSYTAGPRIPLVHVCSHRMRHMFAVGTFHVQQDSMIHTVRTVMLQARQACSTYTKKYHVCVEPTHHRYVTKTGVEWTYVLWSCNCSETTSKYRMRTCMQSVQQHLRHEDIPLIGSRDENDAPPGWHSLPTLMEWCILSVFWRTQLHEVGKSWSIR